MDAAPDRYRYVFEQPFARVPGTQWTYSGGDGAVIARILADQPVNPRLLKLQSAFVA